MAKTQYTSIWKDDQFWKRVKNGYWGFDGVITFYFEMFTDIKKSNDFLYTMLVFSLVGLIIDAITENYSKDKQELVKRIIGRGFLALVLAFIFYLVVHFYTSEQFTLFFFITSGIILSTLFQMLFKEKLSRSDNVLKYIFNDTPAVFSKQYLKEKGVIQNIFTGIWYLALLAYTVYFIFFRIL
jgi:hypothetical protein